MLTSWASGQFVAQRKLSVIIGGTPTQTRLVVCADSMRVISAAFSSPRDQLTQWFPHSHIVA
jgi:hypothetical protein